MGQGPKKYHISDDGQVYRINDDGSFTSVGNIEDIEKKTSSAPIIGKQTYGPAPVPYTSKAAESGWWMRNYNWLWVVTLVVFISWFSACLSFSEFENRYWSDDHYVYYYEWNFSEILGYCLTILLSFAISWFISSGTKIIFIFKWLQIAILIPAICSAYTMLWHLDPGYALLLLCVAIIPFSSWIVTLYFSIFRHR